MALARCNLVITDEDGNVINGASVEVLLASTSLPVQLYSDRDGMVALGNPFTAPDGAEAGFYVDGGSYNITATLGAFSRTWPDEDIGTARSLDIDDIDDLINDAVLGHGLAFLEDYGAVGDGLTDDSAAIRAAIAANPQGIVYGQPKKFYAVTQDGSNAWCIRIVNACSLDLQNSWIKPLVGVGSGVDTILVQPAVSGGFGLYNWAGWYLRNLSLGNNQNGTRLGRHGIFLDTLATGALISRAFLDNVNIFGSTTGGLALKSDNTNVNGLFTSTFSKCLFWGGVDLVECGDSLAIIYSTILGDNAGVRIKQVAGASKVLIHGNNITAIGGSIIIERGQNITITDNNIELFGAVAGGSNGAVIDANGSVSTLVGVVIRNNLIGGSPAAGITSLVRVRNTSGFDIRHNDMVSNSTPIPWLDIDTSATFQVGRQYFGTTSGGFVIGSSNTDFEIEPSSRPFFAAQSTAGVTLAANGFTKIPFNVEISDSDANYDNATNYRFNPKVPGKYFAYTAVALGGAPTVNALFAADIYKNGTRVQQGLKFVTTSDTAASLQIQAEVDMNGTTDYLEVFAFNGQAANTRTIDTTTFGNIFGAHRLGA